MTLNSGTSKNLEQLCFPSPQTGFVVGEKGTILKTTDSGVSWQGTFLDSTQDFVSVSFPTTTTGYAISGTRVYRTQNTGQSWQLISTDNVIGYKVICFVNDSTGFIGTASGILKTVNYGNSWINIKNTGNAISSVYFTSAQTGYFSGGSSFTDQLYKTTNQGLSFTNYSLSLQSIKERVFFPNDSVGYLAGWYAGCLSKTVNGGQTWQTINANNDTQAWDVYFRDALNGFYINNSGGFSKILSSGDGGNNWTTDIVNSSYSFKKFVFTTAGKGFAVGKSGGIYSTQLASALPEKQNESGLFVYPNPSDGNLSLRANKELLLVVYDHLGQQVWCAKLSGPNHPIEHLAGLSEGIYFLHANDGNKKYIQKIIVLK
ncbi:MAG TPA: YCF48-related protein [Bacteroidia bacterium]|nr:YCF48-related protein [Bacteroidia bacterium]